MHKKQKTKNPRTFAKVLSVWCPIQIIAHRLLEEQDRHMAGC